MGVIIDILQSTTILVGTVVMFFLIRRVNRHETRLDAQKIAKEIQKAHAIKWEEPKAVCGCGHHQCFHDDKSCGKIDTQPTYSTSPNSITRGQDLHVPCGCKRYTGPEPLPTVIP